MIYAVPSTLRCHRLTALLLSRSQSENPSLTFSDTFSQRVYRTIYEIWEQNGEQAAEKYAREARMR